MRRRGSMAGNKGNAQGLLIVLCLMHLPVALLEHRTQLNQTEGDPNVPSEVSLQISDIH